MTEIDSQTGQPRERPDREGETFEYRIKCMNCGLHYSVYSWVGEWHSDKDGGYCPECGRKGGKLVHGPVSREEFIFQLVPGDAPLVEMTKGESGSPFGIGSLVDVPTDEIHSTLLTPEEES